MKRRMDLTRWNRAGRNRFDYIDGNAAEYLEFLRQQIARQFADPTTGLCNWLNPPQQIPDKEVEQPDETLVQRQERLSLRNQRLLETYHQDRRDWAWEISRSFARCCHILTEHINAFANEGFLGTASQWDNVRRLVQMLDYHPAPPASASTWLTLTAKEGKSGIVPKGYQINNSPPPGVDKVIFETLENVFIDAALNELRPRGWNKSEQPVVGNGSGASSPISFSEVMDKPVTYIQGIGPVYAKRLGANFKVKDLLELELESDEIHLREMKAKAVYLSQFAPAGDWSVINNHILADIIAMSSDSLKKLSGNTPEMVTALQQAMRMAEVCLDHIYLHELLFRQLIAPYVDDSDSVKTQWNVPTKPAVEPGEVAMIRDDANDNAEAVRINRVEEIDSEPLSLELELSASPLQNTWGQWEKGNTLLHYSLRWHKKPWLNGMNVIRTKEPHGLNAEAYIGWKNGEDWQYAKVIEADKRNLRLKTEATIPGHDIPLYELRSIDPPIMTAHYEVIVLLGAEEITNVRSVLEEVLPEIQDPPDMSSIFTVNSTACPGGTTGGGGLLPPASLPEIGSFLFPSPMLPMDLVKAAVEMMLSLGVMQIPSTGDFVLKGMPFGIPFGENAGEAAAYLFSELVKLTMKCDPPDPNEHPKSVIDWKPGYGNDDDASRQATVKAIENKLLEAMPVLTEEQTKALFLRVKNQFAGLGPLLALPKIAKPVAITDVKIPIYMFDSRPDRIQKGDWLVTEFTEGLYATKIDSIDTFVADDKTDSFGLNFASLPSQPGELKQVHADFRGELVPYNATINLSPIDPEVFELDQIPENLKVGQEVLVTGCGDPYLTRITDIENNPFTYDLLLMSVEATDKLQDKGSLKVIVALVDSDLHIRIFNVSGEKVFDKTESELVAGKTLTALKELLSPFPDELSLSKQDKQEIINNAISIAGLTRRITFSPPLSECLVGKMVINGNVVQAGHGETQPEKIIGSGNAAKLNQAFVLDVEGISFTTDATKNAGVAAAIDVNVDGRVWEQVSSLKDSNADDHHYEIRMTEEGYVKIIFGDGSNGRRLPSGKNNLKVRYRVGSGTIGNVPADSLIKAVKPNPLLDSVAQPLPASGGGDMEDQTSLRENAPPTLLSLKRAVSLSDFSQLAVSQSSIWQAKAYSEPSHAGRLANVTVIVVPTSGIFSDDIKKNLESYLQRQSLPGVLVSVAPFHPQTVDLYVTIRIDIAAYIPQDIAAAVEAELIDQFSLRKRGLGEPLYLSEVYKVVEAVQGVENSVCVLNNGARVVNPIERNSVIYLDTKNGSSLIISKEEYQP